MIEAIFRKTIDFNELIQVDGETAAICNGNITTDNLKLCSISFGIGNQDLYRANRDEIAEKRAEFENRVWEELDKMKEESSNDNE